MGYTDVEKGNDSLSLCSAFSAFFLPQPRGHMRLKCIKAVLATALGKGPLQRQSCIFGTIPSNFTVAVHNTLLIPDPRATSVSVSSHPFDLVDAHTEVRVATSLG